MKTAPTAPAQPAAAETVLPAAAPADDANFRVAETPTLEDTAPHGEPEHRPEALPAERWPRLHRDVQMDAIVVRRREKLEAERAEAKAQGFADQEPLDPAPPAPEPPVAPVDARNAPAAAEQPQPASGDPAQPQAPAAPVRTHKIVVRGNEITLSDDDMRRAAELGVDSEVRLRHAHAQLEEARRLAAASGHTLPGAGPSSPPAAPPQPPQQEPSGLDRAALQELVRDIQYGDEEKATDALQRIMQFTKPLSQPGIDQDAVAREVYARVNASLGLRSDLQTFGAEYPEIGGDPDLATLAANYVQQLRGHYAQTGTPRAEIDLFREAGNAVRQSVQRWSGGGQAQQPAAAAQPDPAPPAAGQSRITIKRNMPQAPAAAAAQQVTPAPRQKTGTDIVNDMRRARGQPVYA